MIFSSLPFHGIPPHAAADRCHTLFSAIVSRYPIIQQSRISLFLPLKATTFLGWFSLGFVTPSSVPLTSSVVFRLRSSSVVFVVVTSLRQTEHYSPISLLFHSSPSPATGGPGDSNNTPPRRAANPPGPNKAPSPPCACHGGIEEVLLLGRQPSCHRLGSRVSLLFLYPRQSDF